MPAGRKCRACAEINDLHYKSAHAKERRATVKRSRRRNPARCLLWSVRARAKRDGIAFDLEESDLSVPEKCPVLSIPLFFSDDGRCDNTPSVDRLDPYKGYVKGNVAVISWRANRMKSRFARSEFEALLRWWVDNVTVKDTLSS